MGEKAGFERSGVEEKVIEKTGYHDRKCKHTGKGEMVRRRKGV